AATTSLRAATPGELAIDGRITVREDGMSHRRGHEQRISEHLAVLNEPRVFRELVIERASNRVALVREPIDAARARRARLLLYCLDPCAAKAKLAGLLRHQQVL